MNMDTKQVPMDELLKVLQLLQGAELQAFVARKGLLSADKARFLSDRELRLVAWEVAAAKVNKGETL